MHTSPHSNQVLCLHCYLLSSSSPTRRQPRVTSAGELAKIVNVFIIILSSHVFICILIIAYFCSKHLQLFQAKAIAAKKIWQHFSNKQNIQVKIQTQNIHVTIKIQGRSSLLLQERAPISTASLWRYSEFWLCDFHCVPRSAELLVTLH